MSDDGRTWRTWQLLIAAAVALVVGILAGGRGGGNDGADISAAAAATSTSAVTTAATTVTILPTTTTIAPTTTRATTGIVTIITTTTVLSAREKQLQVMASAFEGIRTRLAEAVQNDNRVDVASVDRLELDTAGPTIVLNATSRYTTDSILRDGAWAVTRSMQTFWEPKTVANIPDVIPRFRLTLSTVRYDCPADFMVRPAAVRASRDDWEATCR